MNIKKNNLGVLGIVVFAMSRKYVNSPNFLYVCGEFTPIVNKAGGKQWQTTPKNLPRMQRTRAIPDA